MELLKQENNFELKKYIDHEYIHNFTSLESRKTYLQVLEFFSGYIREYFPEITSVNEVSKNTIVNYRDHITEFYGKSGDEMAPTTVGKHLSIIASFFDYLLSKEIAEKNPVATVKRPRYEVKSHSPALNKDQLEEFLSAIESKESGPLHLALIAALWMTGMRRGEILSLKRKDYYRDGARYIFQYKGKGGKYRKKLIHPRLQRILEDYLSWMRGKNREHEEEDWLFQPSKNPLSPGNLSKSINPRTLNRIIEKYSKKIGLSFRISSHSARATFISLLLDEEVPIIDVAREVAHSNIGTTQGYDRRHKGVEDSLVELLPV